MNLVLDREQFNDKNIFFGESIKNTVMNDSSFIRIIYSDKNIILNGIYLKISLCNDTYKCKFMENSYNKNVIIFIENLEKNILNLYNSNKFHSHKIIDQLIYIISKYYGDKAFNNYEFILKISGIWETVNQIGITYKFINTNHL